MSSQQSPPLSSSSSPSKSSSISSSMSPVTLKQENAPSPPQKKHEKTTTKRTGTASHGQLTDSDVVQPNEKNQASSSMTTTTKTTTTTTTMMDDYPGNAKFTRLLHLNREMYHATPMERSNIVQSIVGSIRQDGGRFLRFVATWPRVTVKQEDKGPVENVIKNGDSDEKNCDSGIMWILQEMTPAQAEEWTRSSLEQLIFQLIDEQRQQRSDEQQEDECLQKSSQTSIPRWKSLSRREPFQDLTGRNYAGGSRPGSAAVDQDQGRIYFPHHNYDIDETNEKLWNHHEIATKSEFENEENFRHFANAGLTPPSPPPILRKRCAAGSICGGTMIPLDQPPLWPLSPIRTTQRKRMRETKDEKNCNKDDHDDETVFYNNITPVLKGRRLSHDDANQCATETSKPNFNAGVFVTPDTCYTNVEEIEERDIRQIPFSPRTLNWEAV